jgi:tRNA (pseudouridine54-N1)-methyltransferase
LQGGTHPGIALSTVGFETLLKTMADSSHVYVLEEDGKDIGEIDVEEHPVFVLGDHIGLPKTAEKFALRYAQKVSIGKQPYLAASCITIMNYLLDADLSKPRHGLN